MKGSLAAGVVLFLAGAACATVTPPPASTPSPPAVRHGGSIDTELSADTSQEWLMWLRTRPLALADFRAPAPPDGPVGARTAYLLTYGTWCRGSVFRFEASAAFLPEHSWVKPRALTDAVEGRRILNHEQTHFNQTEVYARRMRKFFAELYNPCGHTVAELNALADRFVADEAAAQERYDDETSFGLAAERQRVWDQDVMEKLALLEAFANRPDDR